MDIRMKAFGKMLFYTIVIFGGSFAISWLFPLYGSLAIASILLGYMMYMIYEIILFDMKTEEHKHD